MGLSLNVANSRCLGAFEVVVYLRRLGTFKLALYRHKGNTEIFVAKIHKYH